MLWFKVKKVMYIHIFCLLGPHCKQQEQSFFSIWPQKVQNHSTHDNTHICFHWKCCPGALPIMSFVKVCNMWSCQQTVKKALHTWLQAQLGWLVKSYGSWCLCWSGQKVITNWYAIIKIKTKLIIILIVVKMLNSLFYCCKEGRVESFLMISVLQWWHLNREQWQIWWYGISSDASVTH